MNALRDGRDDYEVEMLAKEKRMQPAAREAEDAVMRNVARHEDPRETNEQLFQRMCET
jgi:hypothetical protein